MTLKSTILSVTRRTKNGFTAGEIFDRVETQLVNKGANVPEYNVVRARIAELTDTGALEPAGVRQDSFSGREATTYRRPSR